MTSGYLIKRLIIGIARKLRLIRFVNFLSNVRFAIVKKYCQLLGKNPLEGVYDDNFFNIADHEYVLKDSPKFFADIMKEHYNPQSVVDVGCGCGFYLRELEKHGTEILGIDGSPAARRNLVIDQSKFLLHDATQDLSLPKKYDCAICFEVAEHIPTKKSEVLVSNLTSSSDLVFMTAAPKGQGGHDHINEQPPEFWINLFNKKGYEFLKNDSEKMKKMLADRNAVFWLADNLMVFKKLK